MVNKENLLAFNGFEDGTLGFHNDSAVPDNSEALTFVNNPVREGSTAVKVQIKHDWDYSTLNNVRANIQTDNSKKWELKDGGFSNWGESFWMAFSFYLPEEWEPDPVQEQIAEFHRDVSQQPGDTPEERFESTGVPGGAGKPMTMKVIGDQLQIVNDKPEGKSWSNDMRDRKNIATLEKGKWYDVVMNIKWQKPSSNYQGFIDVWINGEKVYEDTGVNCADEVRSPRPLKYGIYKWEWPDDVESRHRAYVFDSFAYGGPEASYEDVAPEGSPQTEGREQETYQTDSTDSNFGATDQKDTWTNAVLTQDSSMDFSNEEWEIELASNSLTPVNYLFSVIRSFDGSTTTLAESDQESNNVEGTNRSKINSGGRLTRDFSLPSDGPYQGWNEYRPWFESLVMQSNAPDWREFRDIDNVEEITGQERNPDLSHLENQETYDVTDYGADPSGNSPSTSAFNQAIDEATNGEGTGTVFIPEGEFLIDEEIRIGAERSDVTIHGAGYNTVLKYNSEIGWGIFVINSYSSEPVTNVNFSSFRIEGDPGYPVRGIYYYPNTADGSGMHRAENLWIHNTGKHGIQLGHDWTIVDGIYVTGAGMHAIGFPGRVTYKADSLSGDTPFDEIEKFRTAFAVNVVVEDSGFAPDLDEYVDDTYSYGIDLSQGRNFLSNFLVRNCGRGIKSSDHSVGQGIVNGCVTGVTEGSGYMNNTSAHLEEVFMDNVGFYQNENRGVRLSEGYDFHIGTLELIGNGADGGYLLDANFEIENLVAKNNEGPGIRLAGSVGTCNIQNYEASGNGDGAIVGNGTCNIQNRNT